MVLFRLGKSSSLMMMPTKSRFLYVTKQLVSLVQCVFWPNLRDHYRQSGASSLLFWSKSCTNFWRRLFRYPSAMWQCLYTICVCSSLPCQFLHWSFL